MATSSADVAEGFARVGMIIDDGVLALTGPPPTWFPPHTNWGALLTRPRIITRVGDKLTLWTAYTGPSPGRMIGSLHLGDLNGARPGRRWDRVKLDQKYLWIRLTTVPRSTPGSRSLPSRTNAALRQSRALRVLSPANARAGR